MKTIYSEEHRHHNPSKEFARGELVSPREQPELAVNVRDEIRRREPGSILEPNDFGLEPVRQIHTRSYLEFLSSAWGQWSQRQGKTDALPLTWPTRGFRGVEPESIVGKLGFYSFDAGTAITNGTWQAARSSVNVALTAVETIIDGEEAAFGITRPPGHHAASELYGGYSFLNNASIAAQRFLDDGASRVSILDVDYHHGNGSQSIFYDRSDVLYISIHGAPSHDFPFFSGYEEETGEGEGEGFTLNLPLQRGTGWENGYKEALRKASQEMKQFDPDVLVVSLGVDTYVDDPLGHFRLQTEDFRKIGETLAHTTCPVLFVLDGGYFIPEIGKNVIQVLTGFETVL